MYIYTQCIYIYIYAYIYISIHIHVYMYAYIYMGWSENVVYHQMAILVGKLNANQWIFGYPIFGQTHMYVSY